MKKYIFILMIGSLIACNGNSQSSQGEQAESSNGIAQEPKQSDVLSEGRQLIKSSDCKACHMDDSRIIGPSYQEVAEKYENTEENITFLANKIIEGGSGNWGEVPMTPHPQHTMEEARKMAQYVLSLNQN